jgi:enoyl-[acyl-carrier-protein] reductase (NADH)
MVGLNSRTVMIVTTERLYAVGIAVTLEKMGAKVIFSRYLPCNPAIIQAIANEVDQHKPEVNALTDTDRCCLACSTGSG